MKTKKKITTTLAVLGIAALALTGCSAGGGTNTGTQGSGGSAEQTKPEPNGPTDPTHADTLDDALDAYLEAEEDGDAALLAEFAGHEASDLELALAETRVAGPADLEAGEPSDGRVAISYELDGKTYEDELQVAGDADSGWRIGRMSFPVSWLQPNLGQDSGSLSGEQYDALIDLDLRVVAGVDVSGVSNQQGLVLALGTYDVPVAPAGADGALSYRVTTIPQSLSRQLSAGDLDFGSL